MSLSFETSKPVTKQLSFTVLAARPEFVIKYLKAAQVTLAFLKEGL